MLIVCLLIELTQKEKVQVIRRATVAGQITLLTRAFGRGIDFMCRDSVVEANGGVHVLQTFLSEELSEEVQIMGRTARQGQQGSYSMVLPGKQMEKFGITDEELARAHANSNLYELLNQKRNTYFNVQYSTNRASVSDAKRYHDASRAFVHGLLAGDLPSIKQFLIANNRGETLCSRSSTLVVMGATGSMGHLMNNVKKTVKTMFERAAVVLDAKKIPAGVFKMQVRSSSTSRERTLMCLVPQFAVCRDYNSRQEELLQFSPWESRPENLRSFLETIQASGGPEGPLKTEAVETGLWHAANEAEEGRVTQVRAAPFLKCLKPHCNAQVLLIGGMPGNTKQEVQVKRQKHGEEYWSTTPFKQATTLEAELIRLNRRNVPVQAFYVAQDAKEAFMHIATQTGGESEFLDVNSMHGAELLTSVVTRALLHNIGGNDLVQEYDMRFP
jgi:hypothetical protein